jgi:hypothetical protein
MMESNPETATRTPIEGSFLRQREHLNSRNTSNLEGSIKQTMLILLGFMKQPSGSGSGFNRWTFDERHKLVMKQRLCLLI